MKTFGKRLLCLLLVGLVAATFSTAKGEEYWVAPMKTVHASFQGDRGTIARFGDSITYTGAFFKPLKYTIDNTTPADDAALEWLRGYIRPSCWTWQDDAVAYDNGCYSSKTSAWPLQIELAPAPTRNINFWLNKLKPELAVIMWGTNDVSAGITAATYKENMRQVVQACTAYGTIPILTTIPPRLGYEDQTVGAYHVYTNPTGSRGTYVQAIIELAAEEQVPLIDYNKQILDRKPGTIWYNSLISDDGIHPSAGSETYPLSDFRTATLNFNGYCLRNWVTLHALYAVQQNILILDPPVQNVSMTVCDTALSDVPGPQPIRVFPIPAAAGWTSGELVFDNWAAGVQFTTTNNSPYTSNINPPFGNSNVTIHVVQNAPANPMNVVDNVPLYGTQEGSSSHPSADNRFPYRIPRLARDHAVNYLAVQFDLASPAEKIGMFLAASSNNWGSTDPQYIKDDQNFVLQDRSVYVTVLDDAGQIVTDYVSLKVAGAETYCPFLTVSWDGEHKITKASIIHDVTENTDRGVSFMDIYTYNSIPGDVTKDDVVGIADLQAMVNAWASYEGPPASPTWNANADCNFDNHVNVGDLQILIANWGQSQ